MRLLDDEALERLARSPRRQLEDALNAGDDDIVRAVFARLERSFAGTIKGTRDWIAHTFAFAAHESDTSLLEALVGATHEFFAVYPGPMGSSAGVVEPPARVPAALRSIDDALDRFDVLDARAREAQDTVRDWISALFSTIYRERGVDALDRGLRYTGARTLLAWMPTDVAHVPEKRLVSWIRLLHGHFTELCIEEDDEKFTLIQDPCGTCARQIQQGRYGAPLDLAVVEEPHETTWFRGDTPVYRAHIPVFHVAIPREEIGVPWPVVQCPARLESGPCSVLLFKDPLNPAANDYVPR